MKEIKILIVKDDDIPQIKMFKKELSLIKDITSVDIEKTVDSAIKKIKKTSYNLIIIDLVNNEKSALNFLSLIKNKFAGKIIVIKGNENENQFNEIKSFGKINIINRPVDINNMKKYVEAYIHKKDVIIEFDSIDLMTVLQIINVEKKSIKLIIKNNGINGIVFTSEGEIIDAQYSDFSGLEALKKMINLKVIDASLLELDHEDKKKNINIPFEELINKIVKSLDEEKNTQIDLKEGRMFENTFDDFESISGFIAGGIYDGSGKILASTSNSRNLNIKDVGVQAIKLYKAAKEVCSSMSIGTTNFIETHTDEYTFIHTCIVPGKGAVGIVLKKDGNIGMTRFQMKELVEKVKPQFE